MANLSSLTPATTKATALGNLILVTPNQNLGYQPQTNVVVDSNSKQSSSGSSLFGSITNFLGLTNANPPTLIFNYEGEQSMTIESDITDHYVEDNSSIQDQISLHPEVINTHGFIGELNDIPPNQILAAAQSIAYKLITISAYTPALTAAALLAYNQAAQLYSIAAQTAGSLVSSWSSLFGSGTQTKQQIVFQQFYGYMQSRTLFKVQTPWGVFENMAIKSLSPVQDSETRMITDFSVSFKKIRIAKTTQSAGLGQGLQNAISSQRLANQSSTNVDNGVSTGTTGPTVQEGTATIQAGGQ